MVPFSVPRSALLALCLSSAGFAAGAVGAGPGQAVQGPPALAAQETNFTGVVAEVTECRVREGVLTVKVRLRNTTDKEVQVIFDANTGRESLTDSARCGVLIENSEFTRSAPDAALMKELAQAGGGEVLTSVESAVAACRAASEAHAARETRTWSQPLWSRWPWWAAVMGLLSVEWLLRRMGKQSTAREVAA